MSNLKNKENGTHILLLPFPSQGHINPMLQLSKRLVHKGVKSTLAITNFISNSTRPICDTVTIETVSDGYDSGGFAAADSIAGYLERFEVVGSETLGNLIKKYDNSETPFDCVIYDAFMPWALDVAKEHGLVGACFFTQAVSVNYVYYYVHKGMLEVPVTSTPVKIPGLPELELRDMPSYIYLPGTYPAYFEMVLNQYVNVEKADYVLVNSFYELEAEVVETLGKLVPFVTIGPTLPSFYLDNRVQNDQDYGLNLFQSDPSTNLINWLDTKPQGSVVYVAFGSMATLSESQMVELAWGLKATNYTILWVVKTSEESKIPKQFIEQITTSDHDHKMLIIKWSPQLEVLSNKAVGCFFSHGGWNSTIEALSLGVAMVVMPQWTDQTMNAKLVEDVWKVGVRVNVGEDGVVGRQEIERCTRKVMEGDMGKEMKENAKKWQVLAKEAVNEGGTSDKNIDEFVSRFRQI